MNSKQHETLRDIFEEPTRKNIKWENIEKLFRGLGANIANNGGSAITVKIDMRNITLHRPHPQKEAPAYYVRKVRKFLESIGVRP